MLFRLSGQQRRRDLLADSDSEGEDVGEILGGKKEEKSTFEKRQEKVGYKTVSSVTISTELYKEIDWITDVLPANSGQSGLTLQLKQLFQL